MRGGKRAGAGRKPGEPNKITVELKGTLTETCKALTLDALHALVGVMTHPKASPGAITTAAIHILERGHGKPLQQLEHTGTVGLEHKMTDIEAARRVAFLLTSGARSTDTEEEPNVGHPAGTPPSR